jgi:transposase
VFTAEFKVEAVRLLRERRALGVPLTQISRELDVGPNLLRAWTRHVDEGVGGGGAERSAPGPTSEVELRRLQRENAVLRQERDFLKKAAAFFAKESR